MTYDYDLAVVGGGAAGLVASKFAAGVGKKVALIEKSRLGGECTLFGCVPSKALIRTAKVFREIGRAGDAGLGELGSLPEAGEAGEAVLTRVRSVVDQVYQGHTPERLQGLGIKVLLGDPRFLDNHHVEIERTAYSARSFVLCTGSSAFVPPIEGLDRVAYLTNQTLFDMGRLPRSMIILGGGPIGIEIAQALGYLGVAVTVVEMGERILIREDRELGDLLTERLARQGLVLRTGSRAVRVETGKNGVNLFVEGGAAGQGPISGDTLLVAVGRKANVDGLDLEAAGVEYSSKGIRTDRRLRTTAPNIYACGDVAGPYQFSHMAEYQARIAAWNALFPLKRSADYANYLWCTFTDPEFAHAGLTEDEARRARGDAIKVYRWAYGQTDRGRTDGAEFGMAKFICDRSHRLLGAHILGARAGELIHEAQIVKTLGVPFYKLDSVIHVYPTFSDVVKQPAKLCHIDTLQGSLFVRMARRLFDRKGR
jgi:pyruvate/2-oxoglutarate dehydrogenase complex dihydrolipoamide dehydrogenase (E3) component